MPMSSSATQYEQRVCCATRPPRRGAAVVPVLLVLAALLAGSLLACGKAEVGASAVNLEAQASWNGRRITGTVENKGPSKASCVVVEYALVNNAGPTLRTVSARNERGLDRGDSWDFAIENAAAIGARSTRLTKLQTC